MKIRLSSEEVKRLAGRKKRIRLGDLVAKVTKAVGLDPCAGCKKRQRSLNRFEIRF